MRLISLLFALLYIVGMIGLAFWFSSGLPARDRALTGVRLGSFDDPRGTVNLSGHRLQCDRGTPPRCTVALFDESLEIIGQRTTHAGSCQARYRGERWPCRMTWSGLPLLWSAELREPFDLSAEQLVELRRLYLVENIPEATLMRNSTLVAALGGLAAAFVATTWPGLNRARRKGLAALALLYGFGLSYIALMFMTRGLWD